MGPLSAGAGCGAKEVPSKVIMPLGTGMLLLFQSLPVERAVTVKRTIFPSCRTALETPCPVNVVLRRGPYWVVLSGTNEVPFHVTSRRRRRSVTSSSA